MSELTGYRGSALEFLKKAKANVGDVLEVKAEWGTVTGTLAPRYVYEDPTRIVLKLESGYNVGLDISKLLGARVVARGEKPSFSAPPPPRTKGKLPRVLLLGTGGTIASRVDYRTGAVRPAVSAADLHALIPELSGIAKIEPEIIFNIFSENIEPTHWSRIARRVGRAVKEGIDGVVITHGTDTLGYTSAALAFALPRVPIPVVMVAAQRSSDRPSTDATLNLIAGVTLASTAPFSGVYVAMHLSVSDDNIALHRATRVRKNHTSRRDAFLSVGVPLAAIWGKDGLQWTDQGLPPRGPRKGFKPKPRFDPGVALLKFYPSIPAAVVRSILGSGIRATVIEGTGLGHTSSKVVAEVKKFVAKGGMAFMTSQCINGRVNLNVYDTGRDLLRAGVTPLEDMLPETALVKAMWVTANTQSSVEAKRLMVENLAGEITTRRFPE